MRMTQYNTFPVFWRAKSPFETLPTELHVHICTFVMGDIAAYEAERGSKGNWTSRGVIDICNLRRVSRAANTAASDVMNTYAYRALKARLGRTVWPQPEFAARAWSAFVRFSAWVPSTPAAGTRSPSPSPSLAALALWRHPTDDSLVLPPSLLVAISNAFENGFAHTSAEVHLLVEEYTAAGRQQLNRDADTTLCIQSQFTVQMTPRIEDANEVSTAMCNARSGDALERRGRDHVAYQALNTFTMGCDLGLVSRRPLGSLPGHISDSTRSAFRVRTIPLRVLDLLVLRPDAEPLEDLYLDMPDLESGPHFLVGLRSAPARLTGVTVHTSDAAWQPPRALLQGPFANLARVDLRSAPVMRFRRGGILSQPPLRTRLVREAAQNCPKLTHLRLGTKPHDRSVYQSPPPLEGGAIDYAALATCTELQTVDLGKGIFVGDSPLLQYAMAGIAAAAAATAATAAAARLDARSD
jgi:hypothetical protein